MADLSLVTDNFFPTASETFTDNLSGSILAGAAIVPVNSGVEYATGATVVLTVEPGTVNEATFIGKKDTTNQFIECIWTEGNTAVGHSAGATIIDYDSATHFNAVTKGILQFADQEGNLLTQPVRDALGLGTSDVDGWEVAPYTFQVSSGYNHGNREFEVVVPNADVTDEYSEGFKFRFQRNTAPGTQCVDLESSSSQFARKTTPTGHSFTDDFTCEIWVKPESTVANGGLMSCKTATNGWQLDTDNGRVRLIGSNGGASNIRYIAGYHSLVNDEWTHVAATLDMSGSTGTLYYNGVSLAVQFLTGGTSPSALVQAGNFEIGAITGAAFFDGKLSDARLWNVVRTATQIRDNMYQQLVGNETNLIGYWKLSGNFDDSTSNVNHLTGQAGAVATSTDNPFNLTEYAVLVKKEFSSPNTILTFATPQGGGIPNMTLIAPYYSAQDTPYGFPASRVLWDINYNWIGAAVHTTASIAATWDDMTGLTVTIPIGHWDQETGIYITGSSTTPSTNTLQSQWDSATPTAGKPSQYQERANVSTAFQAARHIHPDTIKRTTAQSQSLYCAMTSGSGTQTAYLESNQLSYYKLRNAYI